MLPLRWTNEKDRGGNTVSKRVSTDATRPSKKSVRSSPRLPTSTNWSLGARASLWLLFQFISEETWLQARSQQVWRTLMRAARTVFNSPAGRPARPMLLKRGQLDEPAMRWTPCGHHYIAPGPRPVGTSGFYLIDIMNLERAKGFEPSTPTLAKDSKPLHPFGGSYFK